MTSALIRYDEDARCIGAMYLRAKSSIVDSVKCQIECGQMLATKKASLSHGQWLPWLEEQRDALGFERAAAHRLMKLAANGSSTINLAPQEALRLSRQVWGNHNHRAQYTGENEWYTPAKYIEAARTVMSGIDLDPASSDSAQETVKAAKYFTACDDGLVQEWHGRVWMNPPYAQPLIHNFIEKLIAEVTEGRVEQAIVLTHNSTDTLWFHRLEEISARICFTRGRIAFEDPRGERCAPTQGQAFFYVGDAPDRFDEVFRSVGFVR